jgi:RNase adaptor protein for sRNA GlmZ degradation
MTAPGILVVTGASGSGKTAIVRALEARALPGVRCFCFDTVGVPSMEEMCRDFGGPEQWQAVTTQRWLDQLATTADGTEVCVLDGQTRPSFVRSAAERAGIAVARVVLLDATPAVRHARLAGPRGQPDLVNSQMDCWAVYLRGQADALGVPVIDTTSLGIASAADAVVTYVERVRVERQTAEPSSGANAASPRRSF